MPWWSVGSDPLSPVPVSDIVSARFPHYLDAAGTKPNYELLNSLNESLDGLRSLQGAQSLDSLDSLDSPRGRRLNTVANCDCNPSAGALIN